MAYLRVVKGSRVGQVFELLGERHILGRHPQCEIVLDNAAVSRHHAQILVNHGNFYLEDLRSRNQTFRNEEAISERVQLADSDIIRVCDIVLSFHLQISKELAEKDSKVLTVVRSRPRLGADSSARGTITDEADSSFVISDSDLDTDKPTKSSIVGRVNAKSAGKFNFSINPETKLRAILEIGSALGSTLELDDVFQKTLDGLFQIFPQADEGFALILDPQTDRPVVKATKSRLGKHDDSVRISMTIVRQAMNDGEAILSHNALDDDRFDMSQSIANLQIRSMMCVPLMSQSQESLGVIQLDTTDLRRQFDKDDLELIVSLTPQIGLAVENAHLHVELLRKKEEEKDREQEEREMDLAVQVQLDFLPNKPPRFEDFRFHDYYEAASRVGGDYFDYVKLSDDRIAVALGDVAGKGVPAALLMAKLSSSARFHLMSEKTLSGALTALNAEISSGGLGHRFITLVILVVSRNPHQVTVVNAGHLYPLLRKNNGEIQMLGKIKGGMPLGVVDDFVYEEEEFPLQPGESITIYTDGITEAMNSANDIYGTKRLASVIREAAENVESMINKIVLDVENFCEGRPQRDDICLVCLERISKTNDEPS